MCSKSTFSKLRHDIWKALWLWSRKRHKGKKSNQWIKDKYFIWSNGQDWNFVCKKKDGSTVGIVDPAKVKIDRFVQVKADLNPYDDNWQEYLERKSQIRMLKSLNADRKLLSIWKSQDGKCPICKQEVKIDDQWELHHILEKSKGGSDNPSNLIMLHPNCHRQVHSQKIKVTKPGSAKGPSKGLEPYEGKPSSTVLRGENKEQSSFSYSTVRVLWK